ncbi:MAG: hypothetical protein ACK8QZ_10040, partial [Anaerolineales bacterium]
CPHSNDLGLGASITCYVNYTVTTSDASTGTINITASATAGSPPVTSNSASYSVAVTICDVRHSTIGTNKNPGKVYMTIYNYGNFTIHVSNITIYWNTQENNYISSIYLASLPIWSGSNSSSPAFFSITNNNSIAPGASPLLEFLFGKPYSANGSERIVVQFMEPACPILDSNNSSQLP